MTPVGEQADAAQREWEKGSAALVRFYERFERVMLDGDLSAALRSKIGEIDALVGEQQASLALLQDCRISNGGGGSVA